MSGSKCLLSGDSFLLSRTVGTVIRQLGVSVPPGDSGNPPSPTGDNPSHNEALSEKSKPQRTCDNHTAETRQRSNTNKQKQTHLVRNLDKILSKL